MSAPIPSLIRGTTAFLQSAITDMLAGMNTDLAAYVKGGSPPVFEYQTGTIPSTSSCLICVSWSALQTTRISMAPIQKGITLPMKISALIPQAGSNNPSNFEMAKQVSAEWVWNFLEDDRYALQPTINAGTFGSIKALDSTHGPFIDIFPQKLMDGMTVVRGWSVDYVPRFIVSQ